MEFARAREFTVGAYHDLPNVLLTGSMLLGGITGYRPLVWLSVGLLFFNLPVTYLLQFLVGNVDLLKPYFQVVRSDRCATFSDPSRRPSSINGVSNGSSGNNSNSANTATTSIPVLDTYGPTWWFTSAGFFFFFTLYNALAITTSPPNPNATLDQQNNRNAYCYAVIAISVVFLILAGCRLLSGCESVAGGLVGLAIGSGLAISYWHLLNACGNGLVPDILQIIGNSAPQRSADTTPVVCA
jgi:hypothetical protein